MAFLGVAAALMAALALGYVLGRRSASKPPTWSQRTSRAALGRQTLFLVALLAASQLQRSVGPRLPAAVLAVLPGLQIGARGQRKTRWPSRS